MIDVHILSYGLNKGDSRVVLFPITRYMSRLRQKGISCTFYSEMCDEVTDCNTLIIDHTYYYYKTDEGLSVDEVSRLRHSVDRLLWFDTGDSTGGLTAEFLPVVDGYYKRQLLSDRSRYLTEMPERQLFEKYYTPNDLTTSEEHTRQVQSKSDLDKLGIYWNFALSFYYPYMTNQSRFWTGLLSIPGGFHTHIPWERLYRLPGVWKSPGGHRPIDVTGRFATEYDGTAVEKHRKLMVDAAGDRLDNQRVSSFTYWRELRRAKTVLSPFGWGEICHRDLETFMSGSVLIKPEMEHVDTWPPLYEPGETMLTVDWDMNNLDATVDSVVNEYETYLDVAENGQQRYQQYYIGESAARSFVDRFEQIVTDS